MGDVTNQNLVAEIVREFRRAQREAIEAERESHEHELFKTIEAVPDEAWDQSAHIYELLEVIKELAYRFTGSPIFIAPEIFACSTCEHWGLVDEKETCRLWGMPMSRYNACLSWDDGGWADE